MKNKTKIKHLLLFVTVLMLVLINNGSIAQYKPNSAIDFCEQGEEALQRGESFKAILSFKKALQINRDYLEAYIGLGQAYNKNEAYESALDIFSKALKLDRQNIEAWLGIGTALTNMGRYTEALNYFEKVSKASEENIDAHYGIANIYNLMGKKIWAKRKIETIFKMNPYHYNSLLLMADIKKSEKHDSAARELIEKAITSEENRPEAYVKYGEMILKDYFASNDLDYLRDSIEEFRRALAVQGNYYIALRYLAYVSYLLNENEAAVNYLDQAIAAAPDNSLTYYLAGINAVKLNDREKAMSYLRKSSELNPADAFTRVNIEDKLLNLDFKIMHPSRIKASDDNYLKSREAAKANLYLEQEFYLRKAIVLNPQRMDARNDLMQHYKSLGYYYLYQDELKKLAEVDSSNAMQDRLVVTSIQRQDYLFYKEGYTMEPPVRDVPHLLVLDLWPRDNLSQHVDAGTVTAESINFALAQFGRQQVYNRSDRNAIAGELKSGDSFMADNIEKISALVSDQKMEMPEYLLYGDFFETYNGLSVNLYLLDFKSGAIVQEYTAEANDKYALTALSLKIAQKVYDTIPYRGRVLKKNDDNIIINLGSYDGIAVGDMLSVYLRSRPDAATGLVLREKLIFKVTDADTYISSCTLTNGTLLQVEEGDKILPERMRAARLIE